ncbi:positive regulation of aminoacyl-tRNA ligase [Mactra antiquata]
MPGDMYKIEPFYDSTAKVELPNVMYSLQNVHTATSGSQASTPADLNMDPVSALEARQERIISKLGELRKTLDQLAGQYEAAPASKTDKTSSTGASRVKQTSNVVIPNPLGSGIHDIVINADPSSPPLSLFVLFEMLKQKFRVLATSYTHSSVTNIDSKLCELIKSGSQVTRGDHDIALSVVWKKVKYGPELVVSPAKQSVILGEVNIARYINRLLYPGFDTEDIVEATTCDEWLDTAENQLINGNSKKRNAAVKSLNVRLKKNDWTVGSQFSLVDVVMWSALHQSQLVGGAPENVQKWLNSCSSMPLFQTALKAVS